MACDEPTLGEPVDELLATCLDGPPTEWAQRVELACVEQPGLADELERRYERLFALGILERPGSRPRTPAPSASVPTGSCGGSVAAGWASCTRRSTSA